MSFLEMSGTLQTNITYTWMFVPGHVWFTLKIQKMMTVIIQSWVVNVSQTDTILYPVYVAVSQANATLSVNQN